MTFQRGNIVMVEHTFFGFTREEQVDIMIKKGTSFVLLDLLVSNITNMVKVTGLSENGDRFTYVGSSFHHFVRLI